MDVVVVACLLLLLLLLLGVSGAGPVLVVFGCSCGSRST